jgi:hypothetical protein
MKNIRLIAALAACALAGPTQAQEDSTTPASQPTSQPTSRPAAETAMPDADGYVALYNGKNLDGWKAIVRKDEPGLAERVFTTDPDGVLHVFRDFPDGYHLDTGENDTHGLIISEKNYSRYSFKWEFKWGTKRINNFKEYQYDAGMYYHVTDAKIWPVGLEYQIRYDHTKDVDHTGDIWNSGKSYTWFEGENNRFALPANGGKARPSAGGEHLAVANAKVHGLDGQWNQCEVIVMGDKYAIHKVNGQVVNMMTDMNVGEGPVSLQSETAEIYYRNMKIREFDEFIPAEEFLKEG